VKRAEREEFARQFQEGREYHKTEVAFIRANPVFTPEVGAQKAKAFIAHLTALTEHIEKNWNRAKEVDPLPPRDEDAPAHYEVEVFFTPEQRAEVAALYARGENVMNAGKAEQYDDLMELLAECGLGTDTLVYEDGKCVEVVTITNRALANEWFKNARIDDEDDED
jgi:hypothetical protein